MFGSLAAAKQSPFPSAVLALNPIRYYRLNDYSSGGVCKDSGSQGVNGVYPVHNIAGNGNMSLSPGLLYGYPTQGVITSDSSAIVVTSSGLPTGRNPWTFGLLFFVTDLHFTGGVVRFLLRWNGLNMLFGSGQIQVNTPAGVLFITTSIFTRFLSIATYDGTTVKWYINSSVPQNQAAVLNLATANLIIAADNLGSGDRGGAIYEETFWFNFALSAAQVANLLSLL